VRSASRTVSEAVFCINCGEIAKYRGLKMCARCYQRFKKHGDFGLHTKERSHCAVLGCLEPSKAYGWCNKHWTRIKAHGSPVERKWSRRERELCAIPTCGQRHRSMGLCDRHYSREQKKGHPIWRTPARRKVHDDRPWTEHTVQDYTRLEDR
jgi:hypothetical protein